MPLRRPRVGDAERRAWRTHGQPEIPERRLAETHAYTLPCDWMTTGDMRGVCQGRARRDLGDLLEIEAFDVE